MENIDTKKVANKYDQIDIIWDKDDSWHWHTYTQIRAFIHEMFQVIPHDETKLILNAGSAGHNWDLSHKNIFHIDLSRMKLQNIQYSSVANLENCPYKAHSFDIIICVGSVINYCDPYKVMDELARIIKKGGYLYLEYESSLTLELIGNQDFNAESVFMETFYRGEKESIWYYSNFLIRQLSKLYGFKVCKKRKIHIFSPLVYRLTKNENLSSKFGALDTFLRFIPIMNIFASNVMCLMKKD